MGVETAQGMLSLQPLDCPANTAHTWIGWIQMPIPSYEPGREPLVRDRQPRFSRGQQLEMTKPSQREITPVTGEEWRLLGFYHELDPDRRVWHLRGSRSGLLGFARLIARHAESTTVSPETEPLPLGPYGDLQVKFWERPGIDDESIHGRPDDLRRLAQLIESGLADTQPGGKVVIGPEYAGDVECSLLFEVMDDDFDPADAVGPVPVEEAAPSRAAASPQVAFKFQDPSDAEWEGLVHLEGSDLVFQYEKKATMLDKVATYFGASRPGVSDMILSLSDVTVARFKRGVFGAHLTLQVNDINLLEGVPRTKAGTVRLNFQRADRDIAAGLAAAIDELLEEERR